MAAADMPRRRVGNHEHVEPGASSVCAAQPVPLAAVHLDHGGWLAAGRAGGIHCRYPVQRPGDEEGVGSPKRDGFPLAALTV